MPNGASTEIDTGCAAGRFHGFIPPRRSARRGRNAAAAAFPAGVGGPRPLAQSAIVSDLTPQFFRPQPAGAAPDVVYVRRPRARHYRLTLRRDGVVVATIPARGSEREAQRFVAQQGGWLARARARQEQRPSGAAVWTVGMAVLWRGELVEIRAAAATGRPAVCLAADVFRVPAAAGDLRPGLEAQFARRARIELPARTWELAAVTGTDLKRVLVRNQRTRWGSCSAGGTISLNWRLVQTPDAVRDYIILHELMHRWEMNHSDRFWARVAEVCPGWRAAELWLKRHGGLLGL